MFTDYGKKAYLKVLELEKRVDKLQNEVEKSIKQSLIFDLATPEILMHHTKSINFNVSNDCISKVDLNLKCSVDSEITYKICIDSTLIKSGVFSGADSFSIELPLQKGTSHLAFKFDCSEHFLFNVFSVVIDGCVNYLNVDRRLSSVLINNANYITYLNEGVLGFYSYNNSILSKIIELNDISDGCIAGCYNGELYALLITKDNQIKVFVYNLEKSSGSILRLNVQGASSICGYVSDNFVTIYFVSGGRVFKGLYQKGAKFSYELVNRRGVKVYSSPDVTNAYVISDNKNAKLVIVNQSTCVLEGGKFYHIEKTGSGYNVTYSKDNKVYLKVINEKISSPSVYDYCDEVIKLYDNKKLKRTRDKISVE